MEVSSRFVLEVALDIAVENTIVLIVPESGLGQPFPRGKSLSRGRAGAGGTQARPSGCLLGSLNVFLIIKVTLPVIVFQNLQKRIKYKATVLTILATGIQFSPVFLFTNIIYK